MCEKEDYLGYICCPIMLPSSASTFNSGRRLIPNRHAEYQHQPPETLTVGCRRTELMAECTHSPKPYHDKGLCGCGPVAWLRHCDAVLDGVEEDIRPERKADRGGPHGDGNRPDAQRRPHGRQSTQSCWRHNMHRSGKKRRADSTQRMRASGSANCPRKRSTERQ